MPYEASDVELYQWAEMSTFGATSVVFHIMGPKGKVGFVRDIEVDITTALVGTTTVPEIDVGISSGDATFGRYRLGSAIGTGYSVGFYRASLEPDLVGNPPRTGNSFASHVVLDGGPLTTAGIAGGSYGTVLPAGRIPAAGAPVINVVSGTGGVCRLYLDPRYDMTNMIVGQTVFVQGINGATGASIGVYTISALSIAGTSATGQNYIELSGTTFGGTYTTGGVVVPIVYVTLKAGTGGTPAGGGIARVKIQWVGPETW
jgi:hypothetical protein